MRSTVFTLLKINSYANRKTPAYLFSISPFTHLGLSVANAVLPHNTATNAYASTPAHVDASYIFFIFGKTGLE